MNRAAVKALALGQIVTAIVVVLLAWSGAQSRAEVDALREELADTRTRLVAAERDRDRLQDRVDALTAALLAAGVDPSTVPTEPAKTADPPAEADRPAANAAPEPRSQPAPRPEPKPSPKPQPSPTPPPDEDPPPTCALGPLPILCPGS